MIFGELPEITFVSKQALGQLRFVHLKRAVYCSTEHYSSKLGPEDCVHIKFEDFIVYFSVHVILWYHNLCSSKQEVLLLHM